MKSFLTLGAGNLTGAIFSLARNIIIARLLAPDDFGVATTFAMTMTLIEMASDIGLNKLIVQAKEGEDPAFQASLQGIQAARGFLGAAVLFAFAWPYAWLLGAPDAVWAFQILALAPIIIGLRHLDMYREQRRMAFRSLAIATVAAPAISTLAIAPLLFVDEGYGLMLWALLLHQLIILAVSHGLAERGYRLRWDNAVFWRALRFGAPLLGNSVLLYAIFYGDRFIVSNQLGLTALGWFAAAATLTLPPSIIAINFLQNYFLPLLSARRDDDRAFSETAALTVQSALFAGVGCAVGFALLGALAIEILFTEAYAPAAGIIVLLGVMQGFRIAKTGPFTCALALGETKTPMIANAARAMALPAAFFAIYHGGSVEDLLILAAIGETAAYAIGLYRLRGRVAFGHRRLVGDFLAAGAIIAAIGAWRLYEGPTFGGPPLLALAAISPLIAILLVRFRELRRSCGKALSGVARQSASSVSSTRGS